MNGPKGASGSQEHMEKCPKALAAFGPRLAFGRGTGARASGARQRGFAGKMPALPWNVCSGRLQASTGTPAGSGSCFGLDCAASAA